MKQHQHHQPDCVSNDKSPRNLLPPELSSLYPRIDPITNLHPRYASTPSAKHSRALPIQQFEQLLDQKDLNSIQL